MKNIFVLFALCLLTVAYLIPYPALLLASLISYKYFVVHARKLPKELGITKGKYMIHFTVMNLLFAIVLLLFDLIF